MLIEAAHVYLSSVNSRSLKQLLRSLRESRDLLSVQVFQKQVLLCLVDWKVSQLQKCSVKTNCLSGTEALSNQCNHRQSQSLFAIFQEDSECHHYK